MMQYYGVPDFTALPPGVAATLACGLPPESRSMRGLSGRRYSDGELLLAAVLDRLAAIQWMLSEDGRRGRNRPRSVLDRLTGRERPAAEVTGFASPAAFEAARERIMKGGGAGA